MQVANVPMVTSSEKLLLARRTGRLNAIQAVMANICRVEKENVLFSTGTENLRAFIQPKLPKKTHAKNRSVFEYFAAALELTKKPRNSDSVAATAIKKYANP